MSQAPTPYTRQNDFVADATNNPNIGVSGIASDLDAEYEAIRTSVNQTISRLNEIQRNDGLLRSSVLDPAEYAAINAAVTGATDATNAAVAAASSASSAATSAANASANAATATSAATDTVGYKNLAQAAATNAEASAVNAGNYAADASASRALAAVSEGNAATHKNAASASAVTASTKATEALASAASAGADAVTATTKASEAQASSLSALASRDAAAVSEANAASSEAAAASSESLAQNWSISSADSAAIAATKADEANQSATDAESAKLTCVDAEATIAATEATIISYAGQATARWEEFDARYLGEFSSNPSTDNSGDPLIVGATFFNSSVNELRVWDGSQWMAQYINANNTVTEFNGRQGIVSLLEADVVGVATGAVSGVIDTNLSASRAVVSDASGKVSASSVTSTELGYVSGVTSSIQTQLTANAGAASTHIADTANPHAVTAAQVGLGSVDNTSDADKPISTATAAALAGKISSVGVLTDAFTGDGAATAFTLSASTAAPFVTVFIDGVYQHKATYTVAGTALTFSAAPPSGAAIDANILQAS